jgi:hypothetical protein
MNPHAPKVAPKTSFEVGAAGRGQNVAVALYGLDFLLFFLRFALSLGERSDLVSGRLCLDRLFFLFLLQLDLPLDKWRNLICQWFGLDELILVLVTFNTGTASLHPRLRHTHHLVGDPVGFLLVLVVRLANGELGLDHSRAARASSVTGADRYKLDVIAQVGCRGRNASGREGGRWS